MQLTRSEFEIMQVLWRAGRPLSRHEIISLSENRSWKESSVHILLNGLLKKKAICESGYTRCEKTYGRLYAPTVSCEQFYEEQVFSGSSGEMLPMLFSALLRSKEATPELMDELEEMLKKRREELSAR